MPVKIRRLSGAQFDGADFTGASFYNARCQGTSFASAQLALGIPGDLS